MDIVKRVKGILLIPETEWLTIEEEPGTPGYLFGTYAVYLAAIPALAGFIGASVIGVRSPLLGTMRAPLFTGLLGAVVGYVLNFVVIMLVAVVIDRLAPRFCAPKNFPNPPALTGYSHTPSWLGGMFFLVPGLRFLASVVGLYGIYLLWLGVPRLMKTPSENALGYVAAVVVCVLLIGFAAVLIPHVWD